MVDKIEFIDISKSLKKFGNDSMQKADEEDDCNLDDFTSVLEELKSSNQ